MSSLDLTRSGLRRTLVIGAEDRCWDSSRRAFNLLVDQRPRAIALPTSTEEMPAMLAEARRQGLRVTAQGTGHNAGPLGDLRDTLLVNTSRLTDVSIDVTAGTVRVGAGVKWQHVVPRLSDLGLAALHGSSPDVGIVGYSLGGGLGWLARKHGLHANAVRAFEVVTADGQLLRTDADHEACSSPSSGRQRGAVTASVAGSQVGLYADFVEEPADARRFFDPVTWARLREVKRRYDPTDLIRGNHAIPPA